MGIRPKKLSPNTAEILPRNGAGARSCTMVLASPKFSESAMASTPIASALKMKLLKRDSENNASETRITAPAINRKRFLRSIESNPSAPRSDPVPEHAMR